jgi:hypothetical protein
MNIYLRYVFIYLILSTLLVGSSAAQIRVFAQVDTDNDIYVGENFSYNIIIDGTNKAGQVDLAPLAQYNPQSAGNRDVSQTSISIINGKTTQNITKRYVMSYLLSSNQTGSINLPAVRVTIDGKIYQTNAVDINVIKPGTTDQLDLEVTLSEQQCYVGQPVIMTIKFYISADIGDFNFNIPAFTSDDFYIEEPDSTNPQAREYNLGNGLTVYVSQYRTTHNNRESILLTFSKVLIPKRAGTIEIEPATVSADVAVGRTRNRNSLFDDFFGSNVQYKRFMVGSEPTQLNVLNLPDEGKPSDFYGLVGKYTITSSATPIEVSVGDPITLNIKIGGSKYLKPVQWPELEQIPELKNNFKIPSQKASPTIEDGTKVFTQTIRANNDRITEIPPIPLAYFDAEKGQYVTAKTEPIKIKVSPSKVLTGEDLEGTEFVSVSKEVEATRKGLSANYESLDALENQSFSPVAALVQPDYLVIWGMPLALLIFSSLHQFLTHSTPEKVAKKRQRNAAGKAIGQLKEITSAHKKHELLASTMKQYIGERFDKSAGSLTPKDCFEIIAESTDDKTIAEKYQQIIADCEAARYASIETDINSNQIAEVEELIKIIEKKFKK